LISSPPPFPGLFASEENFLSAISPPLRLSASRYVIPSINFLRSCALPPVLCYPRTPHRGASYVSHSSFFFRAAHDRRNPFLKRGLKYIRRLFRLRPSPDPALPPVRTPYPPGFFLFVWTSFSTAFIIHSSRKLPQSPSYRDPGPLDLHLFLFPGLAQQSQEASLPRGFVSSPFCKAFTFSLPFPVKLRGASIPRVPECGFAD